MNTSSSSSPSLIHSNDTPSTKALPVVLSRTTVASTKWLSLQTFQYKDGDGKIRFWDCVSRTTKNSSQNTDDSIHPTLCTDAVIILPILRNEDGSLDTILVEQFRPPVQCSTLEFPAGLVDRHESIQEAALRELYEETGYVGESSSIQPMILSTTDGSIIVGGTSCQLCMSPGLADELVQVVIIQVDCTRLENQNQPKQHLDDGEDITLHRVPLTSGLRSMLEQQQQQSKKTCIPIMGLYMFAVGFELGKVFGNKS